MDKARWLGGCVVAEYKHGGDKDDDGQRGLISSDTPSDDGSSIDT